MFSSRTLPEAAGLKVPKPVATGAPEGFGLGLSVLFTLGAVSRAGPRGSGSDTRRRLPARAGSLIPASPPATRTRPGPPRPDAHVSEAVPVLNLAAVLRDGRQPLLVLHEIAGGLALLEPLGVAFSQSDYGEEEQRQSQPPGSRGAHRGLGLDLGGVWTSAVFEVLPSTALLAKRCGPPQPSSCCLTPVTDGGWVVAEM